MASPNLYPSPFITSGLGPDVLRNYGNLFSGSVYWVSSLTGNDANDGTEPELPKATLVSALSVVSAGDTVLVAAGHVEAIAAAQTLSVAGVAIIGMGIGGSRPKITSNVAGVMLTVSGAYTRLNGLYFPASTAATTARIAVTSGTTFVCYGSYFECGVNDTTNTVTLAANDPRIESCSFVTTASRPARGVNVTGAISGATFRDVLFDGAAYGWSSAAFGITAAATRIWMEDVRLANGSDFVATTTGTSYQMFGVRAIDQSGSRIVIAS